METSTQTLLFAAELIEENGTYTLVVEDVDKGTVQSTPVPRAMVDRLPVFLAALTARFGPEQPRRGW
ncbi:hypothetical protein [Streptomyces sp. CB02460]|uniref:hypothetical protein n=1 Tax=Streptomyces sp. CB02460 TaxID=1703941 RepID=UPI00093C81B0|nr:hypothetical protein [Streptomyces sp. CB02460]OKJ73048.1 hypothetical protein AMK30_19040 [Streptomyces sp. CB02460]